jgi:SAM-dependent methyltransferase
MNPISNGRTEPYTSLAPLYDSLLSKSFFPALRRNFEQLTRRYRIRFQSAADVACGTGLFVHYIHRRGAKRIYGVDHAPAMLRVALARNRGNDIDFFLQDFAHLQLPRPVDMITCNFDSLNYLLTPAQILQALQRFHENMKPEGHLIFDMITMHQSWGGPQPLVERVRLNGVVFQRWMHMDPQSGLQKSLIQITRGDGGTQEIHYQRAYPLRLIVNILHKAGFRVLGMHDFINLRPVTSHTRRVVFVSVRV